MGASRTPLASRPPRVLARLGSAAWVVGVVGGAAAYLARPASDPYVDLPVLMVTLTAFFVLLVVRLLLAAAIWPGRRVALLVLAAGVALWATGSAALNASGASSTEFPAPGEWLFLASYGAMAAYLLLDVGSRRGHPLAAWLDATIVCGGATVVAGALLLTPVVAALPDDGVPLLVALLYPVLDLSLALVVVAQSVLGTRAWSRVAWSLIAGFVLFAAADSSFLMNLSAGTYGFTIVLDLAWGVALALIVGAACRPRPPVTAKPRPLPEVFLVGAALAALVMLLVLPDRHGLLWWCLAAPAALALLAAGGRLMLALRDSRSAAEAIVLSRTDDLTGLPNRRAVLHELDEGLAKGGPLALMLLDLDAFKEVNDTLGHGAGDAVLELAAVRMLGSLPLDVTLARVGGDEFALIVHDDDQVRLLERATAVRDALQSPLTVEGLDLVINASVGITTRTAGDQHAGDLLRRADIAMYEAKMHRLGAEFYDPSRDEFTRTRLRMGEELRRGIESGQLTLWYHPQVDATTEAVIAVEALARWEHPERGVIGPLEFLPVARRAGLMPMLTERVMSRVVADAVAWRRAGLRLRVSFNLGPPELLGGTLMPELYRMLGQANLPRDSITVEVTEDSFLTDPERARKALADARRQGVQTSIDDYGIGFSSLAYLRDLPLNELKIDRSFVSTVRTDERSRVIVASTCQMAHALGLRVVAEGVENAATAAELVAIGVDILQGYHLSRPMPVHQIEPWVRRWNEAALREDASEG